MRAIRADGNRCASACSRRCVPWPRGRRSTLPHSGQRRGTRSAWPQWWQRSSPASRCTTRRALQRVHPACQPHAEQSNDGEYPRRLMKTSDCSPRARRRSIASSSGAPMPSCIASPPSGASRSERKAGGGDGALRQPQPSVASALRVQQRFQRRRRTAQHDRARRAGARARRQRRDCDSADCPAACTTGRALRRRSRARASATAQRPRGGCRRRCRPRPTPPRASDRGAGRSRARCAAWQSATRAARRQPGARVAA